MILTGKDVNSVQDCVIIESQQLLISEVLHIALSHIKDCRYLNKLIHQIIRNRTLVSLWQCYRNMWVGFWLTTETHFILKISKNDQWNEQILLCKTVLQFCKVVLHERDLHVSICGLLEFKWFFPFNYDNNFLNIDSLGKLKHSL